MAQRLPRVCSKRGERRIIEAAWVVQFGSHDQCPDRREGLLAKFALKTSLAVLEEHRPTGIRTSLIKWHHTSTQLT